MIRTGGFMLASLLFISLKGLASENPASSFTVADTLNIDINVVYDSQDLPEKYTAYVITPVCEADKCYIIEIVFYWDLIGRFLYYDTIPGKGLTKLDHKPLAKSDYPKLNDILSNRNSVLASYTKEALVKNTRSSEIDGITGATVQEIKESVIGGAVYSCFTLWHIANGPVVDSVQRVTETRFSKNLVTKLTSFGDQEINYFLINNLSKPDFADYLPEVLQTIGQGEGYYAKHAIEKIPEEVVANPLAQDFFASNFDQLNYFAQVALLEKLNEKTVSEELILAIKESLDDRNSRKNDLIKRLLDEE